MSVAFTSDAGQLTFGKQACSPSDAVGKYRYAWQLESKYIRDVIVRGPFFRVERKSHLPFKILAKVVAITLARLLGSNFKGQLRSHIKSKNKFLYKVASVKS